MTVASKEKTLIRAFAVIQLGRSVGERIKRG